MSSKKMGRRKFIKGASSAFIGLATAPLMNFNLSFAETEQAGCTSGTELLEGLD